MTTKIDTEQVRSREVGKGFRNTGTLKRDGFVVAEFETDAKKFPRQVGRLYIDGNWFTVEQATELRDFLNEVLP